MNRKNVNDNFKNTFQRIHKPRQNTVSLQKITKSAPHSRISISPMPNTTLKKGLFQINSKKIWHSSQKQQSRYGKVQSTPSISIKKTKKKSMNYGYISHLYSLMRKQETEDRQKSDQKEEVSRKNSFGQLKNHLQKLGGSNNEMVPQSYLKKKLQPKILQRFQKSQQRQHSKQKVLSRQKLKKDSSIDEKKHQIMPQVTHKQMKEYTKYIESKVQKYYTRVDFEQLRGNCDQKTNAFDQIDLKQCKMIESLSLCILDALQGSLNTAATGSLIQEYCVLFFQNQERRKLQVALNHHIFKSFIPKIKTIYTYHRIFFYLSYKLAEFSLLFGPLADQILINIVKRGLKTIQSTVRSMFQAVIDAYSKNLGNVMEAFRSLKVVKQIQKYIPEFDKILSQFQQYVITNPNCQKNEDMDKKQQINIEKWDRIQCFSNQFGLILANLKPFLTDSAPSHKFQEFMNRTQTILNWNYLGVAPVPYLPEKPFPTTNIYRKYTLVIGLNQVLIFYNPNTRVLKYRPYMDIFLEKVKQLFEIVLFSDFDKEITDRIVRQIEKQEQHQKKGQTNSIFQYRLYRTHLSFYKSNMIKDLTRMGRNLSHTIILDHSNSVYINCIENGFPLIPFKPQITISSNAKGLKDSNNSSLDKHLFNAMKSLVKLNSDEPADVRQYLRKLQGNNFIELEKIPEAPTLEERSISISHSSYINNLEGGKKNSQK